MRKLIALTAAGVISLGTAAATLLPATTSIPLAHGAQVDYFLKLEGVEGESTDDKHKGEIDIQSFSWGVSQQTTHGGGGGGGSAGKASFQDISFMKRIDKSSPILFQSVPEGRRYPSAILVGEKDGFPYMRIKFYDVLISSYQQTGDQGSTVPTDKVSMSYSKIEYEYTPQSANGAAGSTVKGSWNLKENKK